MDKNLNKVGRPKIKRDCEMTRVLIPIPLKQTVKQMVKDYDNTGVIPEIK